MLIRQLQRVRFEKAIDYIDQSSYGGRKKLNSQELAQINNIIRGTQEETPWRIESTQVDLPSGKKAHFSVVSNPIVMARQIISDAFLRMDNGSLIEAAIELYSQLVLSHLFKDANRRTAVAATYWLLSEKNIQISALGLLELGLGDLRSEEQNHKLAQLIEVTVEMAKKDQKRNLSIVDLDT